MTSRFATIQLLSILSHELLAGVFKSLSNPKQLQVQPVNSGTSFLSQPVNTYSLNLARSTFFCSMVEPWLFKSRIKPNTAQAMISVLRF